MKCNDNIKMDVSKDVWLWHQL